MIRVVLAGIGAGPGEQDPRAPDPGTDLATTLRNDGMEAVFVGWNQVPEQVVRGALHEDAVAIGLCNSTAALLTEIRGLLAENDAAEILVFGVGAERPEAIADWLAAHLNNG